LQVNQPEHAEYFVMKPEPGSSVTDQRLARQDGRTRPDTAAGAEIGKPAPGVSYTQPADDRDLEKVIQQAQAGRDNIDAWSGEEASSSWIIIGLNGVLIVAVIIGLVVYQHRHR
jgi:hypothetical protein